MFKRNLYFILSLSNAFSVDSALKEVDALSLLPFNFDLEYTICKVRKSEGTGIEWDR
jgi:hypothetical protein